LQQKLKQSETVTTERDSAIAKAKELEEKLSHGNLQNSELAQTRSQLQTVEQKFKNFQASVVANRKTTDEETSKLLGRNQQLQQELEKARSQSPDNAADNQRIRELESQLLQANNAASELNQAKANIANLNTQLNEARMELSKNENNAASGEQSSQLARQNEELKRQLEQTKNDNSELREARIKLAEVTTQLNNARARNNQLAAGNATTDTSAAAPVTSISVGQIKKLQNEIAEKDQKIAALQKKANTKKGTKSKSKAAKPKSKKAAPKKQSNGKQSNGKQSNGKKSSGKASWQQGKTKLGTPGSNHKDDLTVINGIGPKIQKVLNRLGIKSYEQLATLRAAEVKLVDEALVDFSGRIKRDEWVPQAKVIMRNGHQPPNAKSKSKKAAAKKPRKTRSRKNAWQKGKTKFGTPGSTHRDDLKVINGIGPVIEKSLNRSGVRSWEQLATLKVADVKAIDEALNFPGRIQREQWVQQAKALIKQFPDNKDRPTRRTYLNQAAG